MSKFKRLYDGLIVLNDKTKDKTIYEYLILILGDADFKKISGIYKNSFAKQACAYYTLKKKFTLKYKSGLLKTLKVYADNIKRAGKI